MSYPDPNRFAEREAVLSRVVRPPRNHNTSSEQMLLAKTKPAVYAILDDAAKAWGITVRELREHCNEPARVNARTVAARRLRLKNFSLPQIGRILGGPEKPFHHTTVLGLLSRRIPPSPEIRQLAASEIPVPDLSGEWAI